MRGMRQLLSAMFILLAYCGLAATDARLPHEVFDQSWRLVSLLEDAGLEGRNIYDLDFVRTNSVDFGSAWIATSDGLYHYDGYAWMRYSKEDGLPSSFVRSVLVASDGIVWAGTDKGLGRFDGRRFHSIGTAERQLAGPNVRRIHQEPDGTIWMSSDSWPNAAVTGGLTSFKNGEWQIFRSNHGLPNDYVFNFFQDSAGRQFATTLTGVAERIGGKWNDISSQISPEGNRWNSGIMTESPALGVLFSNGIQVFALRDGKWAELPGRRHHEYGLCRTRDGKIIGCVDTGIRKKAIAELTERGWVILSSDFDVPVGYIEQVKEAPDGSIWVVGFDCLFRWVWRNSEWREFKNVPEPALIDQSGRIWLHGEDYLLRRSGEDWEIIDGRFYAIHSDASGSVWGVTGAAVFRWHAGETRQYTLDQVGLAVCDQSSVGRDGTFWIWGRLKTGQKALAMFDGNQWYQPEIPEFLREKVRGVVPDQKAGVWFLAQYGNPTEFYLVRVSKDSHEIVPVPRNVMSLWVVDVYADTQNRLWLFGDNGLFKLDRGHGNTSWQAITNLPARQVTACFERDQELWFACTGLTGGRGALARLKGDTWKVFDAEIQPRSSSRASNGSLAFGGRGRVFLVSARTGEEPLLLDMVTNVPVTTSLQDKSGVVWIAAGGSLWRYRSDGVLPGTKVMATSSQVMEGNPFTFQMIGYERFFPKGLYNNYRFSWRMDEGDWSPFVRVPRPMAGRLPEVALRDLAAGRHLLEVRCQDQGLDIDNTPAQLAFQIHVRPLQERAWFIPTLICTILLLAGLASYAWTARSRLRIYASELERRVRDRTVQLEHDIAERQRTEAALRESRGQLRLALDAARMGTWVLDVRKNEMHCSSEVAELLSLKKGEEVESYEAFLRIVHSDDRDRIDHAMRDIIGRRSSNLSLELRIQPPHEAMRWLEINGVVHPDDKDRCDRIIGTILDITERKQQEESIRNLNQDLEHRVEERTAELQAVNRELEAFSYSVSHDLRAPLRHISGFATMLADNANQPDNEEEREIAKKIIMAAGRMTTLIDELLSFARMSRVELRMTEVSLQKLLDEVIYELEPDAVGRNIEWKKSALPNVICDAALLKVVFHNLIGNALKYTRKREFASIEVGYNEEPGEYVFSVKDNGAGFDMRFADKLFGVFQRLHRESEFEGIGIGLANVRRIIQRHGGRTWAEGKPGQGATFYFSLLKQKKPHQ